jgi:hypothetical protein
MCYEYLYQWRLAFGYTAWNAAQQNLASSVTQIPVWSVRWAGWANDVSE